MGAQARIVVVAESESRAAEAANAAFARMDAVEAVLSDWRVDSEARRLASAPAGEPVPVSQDLFDALHLARDVSARTGGAFDVTVGPLVGLWRGVRSGAAWPPAERLDEARSRVGFGQLTLGTEARTVQLARAGVSLDFGGVGKGMACDRALAVLGELGFDRALVELGGDVALSKAPPGAAGWEVRVACGQGEEPVVRFLAECGIATSGRSEQFLEKDGRRYSHIIDPRSGLGVEHDLCVTVRAPNSALADALASAVSVLGARAGRQAALQWPDVHVRIVDGATRPLFDGRTLAGWTESGGRYDGDADWTVEDGAIVGRVGEDGRGGLLYTEATFDDFVFETEVRVDYPFDSGIFVRMVDRTVDLKGAQVTIDYRDGGEISGIYSDGWLWHSERQDLLLPERWNHFEVRCTGEPMRLEVWINGAQATDYRLPADSAGYAPRGKIGIQVHGDRDDPAENAVRFRDVRLRELPRGE